MLQNYMVVFLVMLMILIFRWADLPVIKGVLQRSSCSLGRLLRLEGVVASCALAEVCVWAWELSPGQLQAQPRAEDPVKVRDQHWFSVSQSNQSVQQLVRKAKATQVCF